MDFHFLVMENQCWKRGHPALWPFALLFHKFRRGSWRRILLLFLNITTGECSAQFPRFPKRVRILHERPLCCCFKWDSVFDVNFSACSCFSDTLSSIDRPSRHSARYCDVMHSKLILHYVPKTVSIPWKNSRFYFFGTHCDYYHIVTSEN